MAHKETVQNNEIKAAMPGVMCVYTVSSTVGYGCTNMPEDVRLVQFFINAILSDQGEYWDRKPAALETDGRFGGKTWSAVKKFQKWANSSVDGVVSPVNGIRLTGKNKGLIYTMYYLNWYYWQTRPHYLEDLRRDPALPHQLKTYLGLPLPNLY